MLRLQTQIWCAARPNMHNDAYLHASTHRGKKVFGPPTAERECAQSVSTEIVRRSGGREWILITPYSAYHLILLCLTNPPSAWRAESEKRECWPCNHFFCAPLVTFQTGSGSRRKSSTSLLSDTSVARVFYRSSDKVYRASTLTPLG